MHNAHNPNPKETVSLNKLSGHLHGCDAQKCNCARSIQNSKIISFLNGVLIEISLMQSYMLTVTLLHRQ